MPVTVIVGGQFGGEGKGKVAHYLAQEMGAKVVVRVGGSNSGHTVINSSGSALILRQLPTPSILPNVACVLGAGSYIDVDLLFAEIALTGLTVDRLFIDPNATVVTENEINEEMNGTLRDSIGSTQSGTGAGVVSRIRRNGAALLAKDDKRLRHFVRPVVPFMRDQLSNSERIIIEGTQGFGLSLLHSPYYPYATSRDTSAAAFVSEAGLSPLDVDDIVLVIRTYPIRVGGNSGPLPNEIDWSIVSSNSNNNKALLEHTSVTNTIRRVAKFDADIVLQAIAVNNPTRVVLNHLDYIANVSDPNFYYNISEYVRTIENDIMKNINLLGVGRSKILDRNKLMALGNVA